MNSLNPYAMASLHICCFIIRPNGVRFVAPAGTTEFAKRWNPQPGDIVSFKHRGFMLTSNKPKMPTLFRIRDDITWAVVVHNWNERIVTPTGMQLPIGRIYSIADDIIMILQRDQSEAKTSRSRRGTGQVSRTGNASFSTLRKRWDSIPWRPLIGEPSTGTLNLKE